MGLFSSIKAPFTEKDVPDQSGKVFIVTGSSGGIGKDLARILYEHNAKVYIAARSEEKTSGAIKEIQSAHPNSRGTLIYLHLDLNDLTTIKASATEFMSKEQRLDIIWNNAGVMVPPAGSKTAQGYELQLGTNNVAPFLFTKLLTPLLVETAKQFPSKVIWVASSAAARFSPSGGVVMSNLDYKKDQGAWHKYGVSKAGNILHAKEFARRYKDQGVISIALDPGNLKTDLYQHIPKWQKPVINLVLHEPIYGAYTELFAGLSPDITQERNGAFVQPFGKIGSARKDIELSSKTKAEGGTGVGQEFWEWSEAQVANYL